MHVGEDYHMHDHSGRVRAAMHLLIISLLSAHTGRAVTLASTSFEGTGLAYTLTGEFDQSGGTTTTDYFKVLPNNGTRVEALTIPPSGIFANGDGASCLMGDDTDSLANNVPVNVTFAAVNTTGHNNLQMSVLLAASDGTNTRGFEFDAIAGDYLLVQANVDGAGFQEIAEFRASHAVNFQMHLSRETTGDLVGDSPGTTDANSIERGFKNFTFPIPNGSSVVLRIELRANATGEYIAIDNVRLTGDPAASPPVLSGLNSATQPYTEGQGALVIGDGITVTDPNSANLVSGTVTIGSNFAAGQDVLAVTPSGGITAAYDANTGALSLSGSATLADYQTTLRSLTYTNTDARHPLEATRFIIVQVNDGTSGSNQGVLRVLPADTVQRQRIPFCETFSTDGRGTRYQATNFFDVGADDAFTRVKLPRASSTLTGTGGNDPYAWYGEDTDGQSAAASTLVFDLDTAGYSGLTLTLDLAAAPNAFEPPDEIKIEQSVAGGAFTLVGAFRPTASTPLNLNLARDGDFNGFGEGAALGNAFTRHTIALSPGSDCKVRITVMANATSDELAIGDVCVTGTPTVAAPQPLLYYDFEGALVANLGTLGGSGIILGSVDWDWGAPAGPTGDWGLKLNGLDIGAGGGGIDTGFSATQLGIANSDTYTCAAWINFTKTVGDTMVFSQINQTSLILHNGVRDSRAHLGHWSNDVTGATTLSTGVWHHVVWLYEAGRQSIYVNGKRDAAPEVRAALGNIGNIIIGNTGVAGWGFAGVLDEVCVFDGALSYGQIRALAAGARATALPGAAPANDGEFYTAPFGPGGTWNLYQVVGSNQGDPDTMYAAEVAASTRPNPHGSGLTVGHLPTIESREEAYTLQYLAGMRAYWMGLTDDHTVFGGTEAVSHPTNGWAWTSGLASTYRAWAAGEPNDAGAFEDGVYQDIFGTWNDTWSGIPEGPATPGQVTLPYVIEWNLASASAIPGATVVGPVIPVTLPGPLGSSSGFGVLAMRGNGLLGNIRQAVDAVVVGGGVRLTGAAARINHVDPEWPNRGIFINDQAILADTPAVDADNAHVYKGRVTVTTAGVYTFGVHSDDSFALRVRGRTWQSVSGGNLMIDTLSGGDTVFIDRGATGGPVFARINLPVGQHSVDFVTTNSGGASGHEVFVARGSYSSLNDTPNWRLLGESPQGTLAAPTLVGGTLMVKTSPAGGVFVESLANAEAEIAAGSLITSFETEINFSDPDAPGGGGLVGGDSPFANDVAAVDDEDFAVEITATINVAVEGDYVFGFMSDDGTSLRLPGKTWTGIIESVNSVSVISGDTLRHDANTGSSYTRAVVHLPAGNHTLRGLYWEAGGGANYELFADSAANPVTRLLGSYTGGAFTDEGGLPLVNPTPLVMQVSPYDAINHTLLLNWTTMPGHGYTPEYSYDLVNWYPIRNQPAIATGNVDGILMIQLQPFTRAYYRVRSY